MFQHQGIWLPDGEKHFPEWMTKNGEMVDGRGTYQIRKFREAMKWCKTFRVAIDVGAHVGLWSMQLVKRFGAVIAFEPVETFLECFRRNLGINDSSQVVCLYPYALGAKHGAALMKINPADTGGTHVETTTPGAVANVVPMEPLDSIGLPDVDFLKIDCEGYELEVLKGATDTLARCKPCIIVEQKPHKLAANYGTKGRPAVDFVLGLGLGYVLRREIGGDFILSKSE